MAKSNATTQFEPPKNQPVVLFFPALGKGTKDPVLPMIARACEQRRLGLQILDYEKVSRDQTEISYRREAARSIAVFDIRTTNPVVVCGHEFGASIAAAVSNRAQGFLGIDPLFEAELTLVRRLSREQRQQILEGADLSLPLTNTTNYTLTARHVKGAEDRYRLGKPRYNLPDDARLVILLTEPNPHFDEEHVCAGMQAFVHQTRPALHNLSNDRVPGGKAGAIGEALRRIVSTLGSSLTAYNPLLHEGPLAKSDPRLERQGLARTK